MRLEFKKSDPKVAWLIKLCYPGYRGRRTVKVESRKVYIGQTTKTLNKRKNEHYCEAFNKNCVGYNYVISCAIRVHNKNIKWNIIYDNIPITQLNNMEIWCIGNYNTFTKGYNSTLGGKGNSGYSPSLETRMKISKAGRGRKLSKETCKKMSIARTGKKHSEERRKNISKSLKGRKLSEKHKRKMSESRKGRKLSEEHKKKISGKNHHYYGKRRIEISGENHPSAKLNWNKVDEIRKKYSIGNYTHRKLAKEYDVSHRTIGHILNDLIWTR